MKVQDPQLPSEEEVKCHELTHLPHRSWCSHYVRGKGRATDHRKQNRDPKITELHCFLGSAADTRPRCILVAKQFGTKFLLASVVPLKGASHESCFKSDQQAALGDLLQEVVKRRGDAKWRRPQANGVIERENLSVEGHVMVLKDAFEARLGKKVPSDHAALAWLVEFAAVLINRYEVGHDGRTPYERLREKSSKLLGLEFGERLHFRRCRAAARMAKLDVSWQDGVFLGYRSLRGEVVVGTAEGVQDEDGA